MKSIRNFLIGTIVSGGLAAGIYLLHAQTAVVGSFNNDLAPVQSAAPDSIVQLTADAQGLAQVAPLDLPSSGTFWVIMPGYGGGVTALPYPCMSPALAGLPVYGITGNAFLVDDTGGQVLANTQRAGRLTANMTVESALESQASAVVNLINTVQGAQLQQMSQAMGMADFGGPMPGYSGGGGSGTNGLYSDSFNFNPGYGTNLWIANFALSPGNATGIISNSFADIQYELQYTTDLTWPWQSANWFVYGSELTNWTPFSVPAGSPTNFFLRVRSWADDGSGLPLWWQEQYFRTNGVDPYGDPAGDGWNNLQKFQNGMNPTNFCTPPAPQGVTVAYNPVTGNLTVNWLPSPGPVISYTVVDPNWSYFTNSSSSTTFQENVPEDDFWTDPGTIGPNLSGGPVQVRAGYAGGNSAWSVPVYVQMPDSDYYTGLPVTMVEVAQGSIYLAAASSALPPGTTVVRITRVDVGAEIYGGGDSSFNTNWDIPLSAFTNGFYSLPASMTAAPVDVYGVSYYDWWVQAVDANGTTSAAKLISQGFGDAQNNLSWAMPPYFDGRAQLKQNLRFVLRAGLVDTPFEFLLHYNNYTDLISYPANYAYAGFYENDQYYTGIFDALQPFVDNYRYRNFVFDSSALNSGGFLTNGVSIYSGGPMYLAEVPTYQFSAPTASGTTIPAMLATNQTRWLESALATYYYNYSYSWEFGLTNLSGINYMASNARNLYGLPFLSVETAWGDNSGSNATLYAGGNTVTGGNFYPETAQPQFQTVEYDFWDSSPVPGTSSFSTTNTSDLLIAPVGNSITVNGYAKLALQNGYSGVYGYLQQYFDTAYKITNGIVTTNTTGVLSPYGDFFATEPGPAALVTMPDVDTGQRGTGVVYCVSLNVDKNHAGTMDTSFNGPDATSQSSPMELWVNSGNDKPGNNGNLDKDMPVPPNPPNYSAGKITCARDLENFFRLWICGVPPGALYPNYTFTLTFQNVSGNPAINVYSSCETNGGTGYLTDTNVAATQTGSAYYANKWGTISNNQSYTLPVDGYGNLLFTHFLFEGAGIGEGQLTLTIAQNGNAIAQTGVWLDLHDIKDFYERAVIADNMNGAISNWSSSIETVQHPIATISDEDSNIIVLVHGINVGNWDWLDESDTVFKRLYWAGYQGKFATVDWPCEFFTLWTALSTDTSVFNRSEIKAYKAGTSLKNYLSGLHTRFPGDRLNLLVHSQGNAVAGEAIQQGAPFDTYILTQGAMPDSAYDMGAPTDSSLLTAESIYGTPEFQPMGYRGIYTNFTGRIVNFFNPNDPVLKYWLYDQAAAKPDGYLKNLIFPTPYYTYDGTDGWHFSLTLSSYLVTDPQESRAYISRSLTDSIGQNGPALAHGIIQSAMNLNAQYGFNDAFPSDHSAQWTWPIQTCWGYYDQILESCLIPTIQR